MPQNLGQHKDAFFLFYHEKNMALSYDDILLRPSRGDCAIKSRSNIETVGRISWLDVPIFMSPMDSVVGKDSLDAALENGICAVYPRFDATIEERMDSFEGHEEQFFAISVGELSKDNLLKLSNNAIGNICVDSAHANNVFILDKLSKIPSEFNVMAGNVATREGVRELEKVGVDYIRVGIGGGSACITRIATGMGVPNASAVYECQDASNRIGDSYIIADGGIRNAGDMVKALAIGADAVMCGSLFANTLESPNRSYRGSASSKIDDSYIEGVSSDDPNGGLVGSAGDGFADVGVLKVEHVVEVMKEGLQSALSYVGCKSLEDFKPRFIKQTSSGTQEAKAEEKEVDAEKLALQKVGD